VTDVTLLRNVLILFLENVSLCDLVTGGVVLPIASLRLLRGVSEERKVGSLRCSYFTGRRRGGRWRRG